ncbi:PREDICTED: uncharacterized protein LOC104779150 [Camelina sativa]|uniref:ATP-dependent DNA helicase n=1 Tax=Camelina sativa TaxID=90675 RepID=A0ABM0YJB1_CAMSA|nr:PREDICTED: uncharacterized protein LOC104779150 [Camelina sativa]
MPKPDDSIMKTGVNRRITDEKIYKPHKQQELYDKLLPMLTDEQRRVYEEIIHSVNHDKGGMFFVHGFGGTGKTFMWTIIGADIRAKGNIVLNVASSGIAALLLEDGRTTHSRFGGGFRKILPVITKGGRVATVLASINSLVLWNSCKVLKLTENLRLRKASNSMDAGALATFSKWLLDIGDGKINESNSGYVEIEIPDDLLINTSWNPIEAIVKEIYGERFATRTDLKFFSERAILSPRNDDVDNINQFMLIKLPGEERRYLSSDSIETSDISGHDDMIYTQEFLNNIQVSGLSNHVLTLKIGALVMLLRNIDPKGVAVKDKRDHYNEVVFTLLNGRNETIKCRAVSDCATRFMSLWETSGCHLTYQTEPVFCVLRFWKVGEYEGKPCIVNTLASSKIFIKPEFEGLEHHKAM